MWSCYAYLPSYGLVYGEARKNCKLIITHFRELFLHLICAVVLNWSDVTSSSWILTF
jgi:hypothetical protein